MNRRLSTRILLPNLFIVIGSLVLLALMMLFSVLLFLQQEMTKEFMRARATVEAIIQVREQHSEEDALTQDVADMIVRQTSLLFVDVKALILTDAMQYPPDTANRPLEEKALALVGKDGGIYNIRSGGASYLMTALSFETPEGMHNMVLYTSQAKMVNFIHRLALIILPALAGASLIAVLASAYASRRIADPLRRLSRWAHGIGGRQYGRFELRSGTAEIDFLAESLNGMVKRLEDYDSAQKTFLQNASHELRTPLMSIQGYAEGIKHGVFTDTTNAADVIVAESLRLSALVDDLLYLSRLETADGYYAFAPTPLGEVLGQCAEKLDGAAFKAGKTLMLLPCPDATVSGDGEKLLRAVMNLAGNCLRYAAATVEMALSVSDGCAVITIRDDGPGFDTEDMQHLFTRFYKGKQGKYGLGLSIAKAIVEKHGGTISAANRDTGGAVFHIELPVINTQRVTR